MSQNEVIQAKHFETYRWGRCVNAGVFSLHLMQNRFSLYSNFESNLIQWAKSITFRPETGPAFPQNDKNPKHTGANKIWPTLIGKNYFACFGTESYLIFGTVHGCTIISRQVLLAMFRER